MPRQARVSRKKKQSPTQQETFRFEPKIEPAARPVDYNTRVVAKNTQGGWAEGLLGILNLSGDVVKEGARYKKNVVEPAQEEAGRIAAAKGETLNEDAAEAYVRGYEEMKGAGEGYMELERLLMDHSNQNAGATLEEFLVTQDQAIKGYMAGRTENFIRGILPGALSLQKEYQGQFLQKQQAEFELKKLTDYRSLVDANISKILKAKPEDTSKALREELNHLHANGKNFNLTKQQISNQMVSLMADRAFDSADPELMKFATEPGPDGIRLIDNPKLADKVRSAIMNASNEQTRRFNHALKLQEKAIKDAKADIATDIADLTTIAGDPTVEPEKREQAIKMAIERINMYSDASRNKAGIELSREELDHARKEIQDIYGPDGIFAAEDNADVLTDALLIAQEDPAQLTPAVLETLKPHLTRSGYESVRKEMASTYKRRKTAAHKETPDEKYYKQEKKSAQGRMNAKSPFGHPLFDNGDEREREFNRRLEREIRMFTSKGNFPNPDDIDAMIDKVEKHVDTKHPVRGANLKTTKAVAEAGNGYTPGINIEPKETRNKNLMSDLDALDEQVNEPLWSEKDLENAD
jgi:hypothetical protein